MMDARRRRRPTSATTDEDDDRRRRKRRSATAKKSRALILPKILNFRKIASFWKTTKIWFFSKVPPLDEKGKWWTPGDGDDRRRRRPTKTTTDDDENDDRRRRKNLVHSFCQKSWILERLRVFEKHRKFDFFQRSLPWTKKGNDGRPATATTDVGDDRRRRRPTDENRRRRKNLVHSFCQKSWILERLRVFEKQRKFDFFQRSLPWTKKGNDGRPATATTDVGDGRRRRPTTTKTKSKKSRALILPKILNFRKIASFWKTAKIWFFSKVPPLDEKGKWWTPGDGDDRRRRRPTKTTTDDDENDDRRRRKNLVHSFCQNLEFQKDCEFLKNSENLIFFKGPSLGRRKREMTDDRRRTKKSKKSRALILPKILNFRKIASFWKTSKIWFFSKVPPLDEKGKWWTPGDGDDRRRRRPTTTTTTDDDENDDRRRRKNLVHSFCQKSWILERLRVFEKQRKFDFFQRSLPWTKKGNDGWTDDGEKISCTHFAKNLEF